jgi:hypothetical protein
LERPRQKKENRAKEKNEGKVEASLKSLLRHWVHSHEEDHEGVTVFRPADFPFPPSRGRRGFELRAGGAAALSPLGATDRIETAPGEWKLEGSRLTISQDSPKGFTETMNIVSVSGDKLETRRD